MIKSPPRLHQGLARLHHHCPTDFPGTVRPQVVSQAVVAAPIDSESVVVHSVTVHSVTVHSAAVHSAAVHSAAVRGNVVHLMPQTMLTVRKGLLPEFGDTVAASLVFLRTLGHTGLSQACHW